MKFSVCFRPLIRFLTLLAAAAAITACTGPSVLWNEGEQHLDRSTKTYDSKATASGSSSLRGAALGKKGMSVSYSVDIPADYADAKLIIRYARLHWSETLKPAEINLETVCGAGILTNRLFFDNTGGWGTECRDWGLLEVPLGRLKKGPCKLTFTSDSDKSDVVIDGFWLAESGFQMTREELIPLNRIEITPHGYLGINLNYADIEQPAFTGFTVTGRSFEPSEEKVSVELRNRQGEVVSSFCKDSLLQLENKPSSLTVPGSWVRDLPDGSYTLTVSWNGGKSVLSQPFTAIGSLLAECEKERVQIAKALERHGKNRTAAADLQYASDYLENSLVLLRSRGKAPVEESAYKKGIAYFEKSTFRTTEMFAADLRAFISQTRETVARLDKGLPPYEGRTGDLRRAFYSESTGKLEPYRIYIPSSYGKAGALPVLMTLHGGGGDENVFPDQDNGILMKIMEKRGYLMVSPKATSWYNNPEGQADLKQLLELVQREYPQTDRKRLYCTGVSRGGAGSYQFAGVHPGLLAGIACVSGIGNKAYDKQSPLVIDLSEFKRIPVLVLIGGNDPVIPPEYTKQVLQELKEQGGICEVKIFPEYGHDYHPEEYMLLTLDFFEKNTVK